MLTALASLTPTVRQHPRIARSAPMAHVGEVGAGGGALVLAFGIPVIVGGATWLLTSSLLYGVLAAGGTYFVRQTYFQ